MNLYKSSNFIIFVFFTVASNCVSEYSVIKVVERVVYFMIYVMHRIFPLRDTNVLNLVIETKHNGSLYVYT